MFSGIALGANQAAGKDTIAAYLLRTRTHAHLMRSKTPIVEAFEERYQIKYVKSHEMDAMLIEFSENVARKNDPLIVANWLLREVPKVISRGQLPVIADMRFHDENRALLESGVLCVHIEASEAVRKARIIKRDGDLSHYDPDAHTEVEIADLKYHYEINNNRDDDGAFAIWQLENFLRRQGRVFEPHIGELRPGMRVQVIDVTSPYWWHEGVIEASHAKMYEPLKHTVRLANGEERDFLHNNIVRIAEDRVNV